MPRPTTKAGLLSAARERHAALDALLAAQTPRALTRVHPTTSWSVKDILAHLTAWEQLCLGWYRAGERGETPPLPAPGFNWSQLPALNERFLRAGRRQSLAVVSSACVASYAEILALIGSLSEIELFTRGRPAWVGGNTLGAYFVSATSSHYDWALKLARKCLRPAA